LAGARVPAVDGGLGEGVAHSKGACVGSECDRADTEARRDGLRESVRSHRQLVDRNLTVGTSRCRTGGSSDSNRGAVLRESKKDEGTGRQVGEVGNRCRRIRCLIHGYVACGGRITATDSEHVAAQRYRRRCTEPRIAQRR